ncbi:hypothetical protein GCM10020221_23470 [Streptomyces thioluteus]|uniref:Uncharacterized protein n=1 Tax=Streptomyces thioluteus TaxID=66431 RepID=A0ABN3WWC5_STRTU
MKFVWLFWVVRHINDFGYSRGLLRGSIGTVVVLITAVAIGFALQRKRFAAVSAGALVFGGGIAWLACH